MKGAYILIPLLCTLCAGCDSKDESLMSTREIGFSTTVASSEAEPGTRAEATTDNLTEMGVFAYFTGTGNFSNGSSTPNHLYNQSVKKTGGVWTYSPVRYWPANANEKVSFFAYAPHTAAVSGNANDKIRIAKPTAFNAPGRPVISYSAPKGELDLLLSTGVTDCTNTHGPVQFTMKHAMTKVVFKVKTGGSDSKTITGISTECTSSADFSINDANTAVTAENIGTSKSTCTATVNIAVDGTAKTVKEFFLIPSHPNDTKVTLTYADGSGSTTVTATLPNVTPNDWLSADTDNVDRYMADPLCGADATVGLFRQMLRGLRFNQTPGNIDRMDKNAPILLIAGQDDPVGDMGAGVRRTHDAFKRAGIRDVTLKLYPGLRHEILNEAAMRDTVYGDIGAWLNRVLG